MRYLKTVMIAGLVMSVTACSKAEDAPDNTTALVSNGPKLMSPDGPIRRCMNLGNGLDAPYEGAWDYQIEDHHIVEIARAGFDTMRFPIRWDTRTQLAAPYTIEPEFFDRVDHLLNLASHATEAGVTAAQTIAPNVYATCATSNQIAQHAHGG